MSKIINKFTYVLLLSCLLTKSSNGIDNIKDINNIYDKCDDNYDFMFATDYYYHDNLIIVSDSNNYNLLFEKTNPTENDLNQVLDENEYIPDNYKEFIRNYIHDWYRLYPNSDMAVLYHNLKTLKIIEDTPENIRNREHLNSPYLNSNSNSLAYYNVNNNYICVPFGLELNDKESFDYIILTHELLHASRVTMLKSNDKTYFVCPYYNSPDIHIIDEGIVSHLTTMLQGQLKHSSVYTLQSNYIKMISNAVDYTGEDYINHSINYLFYKMDNYMNENNHAYKIGMQICDEYYNQSADTKYDELYNYMIKMYQRNVLHDDMSEQIAHNWYYAFNEDLTNSLPKDYFNNIDLQLYWDQAIDNNYEYELSTEKGYILQKK